MIKIYDCDRILIIKALYGVMCLTVGIIQSLGLIDKLSLNLKMAYVVKIMKLAGKIIVVVNQLKIYADTYNNICHPE